MLDMKKIISIDGLLILVLFAYFSLTNIIAHLGSLFFFFMIIIFFVYLFKKIKIPTFHKSELLYFYIIILYIFVHIVSNFYNGFILGNFEQRLSLIDQELRLLFFLPLVLVLRGLKIPGMVLFIGLSTGGILSGVLSIYNFHIHGMFRASGSYHAIAFADLSAVMAFLPLFFINEFKDKGRIYFFLPFLSFVFGFSALILSGTRGALFCVPVFFFFLLIEYRKNIIAWAALCIVIFSGFGIDKLNNGYLTKRFGVLYSNTMELNNKWSEGEFSDQVRFELWRGAFLVIKDNPCTGIGRVGFDDKMAVMEKENFVPKTLKNYTEPHNQYLFDIVSSGIISGVLSVLLFFMPVFSFFRKFKTRPSVSLAGMAFSISFFVFGLSESILIRNIFITFFLIIISFLFYLMEPEQGRAV